MPNSPLTRLRVCTRHVRASPLFAVPCVAQSRTSLSEGDDVDLDSIAYGFMASQALFAALEIGIFDTLATSGPLDAAALRATCNVSAPRLQTLLTALVAIKCLRLDHATQTYANSPATSKFMVQSSPSYYGDYVKYQIGRQMYQRMGSLSDVMKKGEAPEYAAWFSDAEVASTYTNAQHNGSLATAKQLLRKVNIAGARRLLDVGGGSGAFSVVFAKQENELEATVLDLPQVCTTGRAIVMQTAAEVQDRVKFQELDATAQTWPVEPAAFDIVLMSYLSGSVPEPVVSDLYYRAFGALRPGGKLIVHDFMVDDSLDGPVLGALWALQHVALNPKGLGLCPGLICERMRSAGFTSTESMDLIRGMTKVVIGLKAQ